MEEYLTAIKDVLVILAPIIIAYISYRSNKQSQKDIKLEVERITKEKEAETKQILEKIGAELESQKQLLSWQNSLPQTNEYTKLIETKRFGNISALPQLCQSIYVILNSNPSLDALTELTRMLERIDLPDEDSELYPHEVSILLSYKMARNSVDVQIKKLTAEESQEEDDNNADA